MKALNPLVKAPLGKQLVNQFILNASEQTINDLNKQAVELEEYRKLLRRAENELCGIIDAAIYVIKQTNRI